MQKSFLPFRIPLSRIDDNLYLGSIDDAFNLKKLQDLKITHILNATVEVPNFYPKSFEYHKINAQDIPSFRYLPHLDSAADFIHQATSSGKILVHCYCGISRSTTAILAYFMKHRGLSFHDGLNFIKKKRWIVCPNPGFVKQLHSFKASLPKTEGADPSPWTGFPSPWTGVPSHLSKGQREVLGERKDFQIRKMEETVGRGSELKRSQSQGWTLQKRSGNGASMKAMASFEVGAKERTSGWPVGKVLRQKENNFDKTFKRSQF